MPRGQEEAREKMRASAKRRWSDPETRRKWSEAYLARAAAKPHAIKCKPGRPAKTDERYIERLADPLPHGDFESVLPLRALDKPTLTARLQLLSFARALAFPDPSMVRQAESRSLEIWNRVTAMIGATLEALDAKS